MSQEAGKTSLARAVGQRFGVESSPAFERLLEMLLSPEEMELLLGTPGVSAAIARAVDRPVEAVDSALNDLLMRGIVCITGHEEGRPVWSLPPLGLLMDGIHFDRRYRSYGPEFYDLWSEVCRDEVIAKAPAGMLRVVPVQAALPPVGADSRVLDIESAEGIVRRARRIAVQDCPCRVRERHCDTPLEMCLSFDAFADYILYRKIGREISAEEALAILRHAEELGLVHQTVNSEQPDVICNCCTCCCVVLKSGAVHGYTVSSTVSRFQPVLDEARCDDCLACARRCHFGATVECDGHRAFYAEKCLGCGLCVRACPNGAIRLAESRPLDHLKPGPSFAWSYLPEEW